MIIVVGENTNNGGKEPLRGKFNHRANREKETAANLFFFVSSPAFVGVFTNKST